MKEVTKANNVNNINMLSIAERDQVRTTMDYSLFAMFSLNRKIKPVPKLKKRLQEFGAYQVCPIIVTHNPLDNKLYVIDGQHRIRALKELNRPIRYIIDNNATKEMISSINSGNMQWTPNDYLNSYIEQGLNNYKKFEELRKELNISLNSLFVVLRDKELNGNDLNEFKTGNFVIKKEDIIRYNKIKSKFDDVLNSRKEFKNKLSKTRVLRALIELMLHENYQHSHFCKQLKNISESKVSSSGTVNDGREMLMNIHNKSLRGPKVFLPENK